MATTQQITHTKADILYDGVFSGAIGGSAVALAFLAIDAVRGEPLFTPTLMGAVLLQGATAAEVTSADLGLVAQYSVLHFAVFGALGLLVSYFVHEVELHVRNPAETLFLAFVAFEALFFIAAFLFLPGVTAVLGKGTLFVVNGVAALAMGGFLFGSHHPGALRRWIADLVRD